MKRLIVIVLLAFIAWKGYGQFESNHSGHTPQGIGNVSPQEWDVEYEREYWHECESAPAAAAPTVAT